MRGGDRVSEQSSTTTVTGYEPAPSVVHRSVDGSIVLLDLDDGIYYTLEGIGSDMWSYLCAGLAPVQIVNALVDEYEVERATVEGDLAELIERLVAAGLLRAR